LLLELALTIRPISLVVLVRSLTSLPAIFEVDVYKLFLIIPFYEMQK